MTDWILANLEITEIWWIPFVTISFIVKLRFSLYISYSTCSKKILDTISFNFQRLLYLHDFIINIAITPCPSAHRRSTSKATMHSGTLWRLLSIEDLDFPSSVHCSLPSSQNWSWQWPMCLFSISAMPSCLKACEPSPEGWDLSREWTLACACC